jgi:hypothetical protein
MNTTRSPRVLAAAFVVTFGVAAGCAVEADETSEPTSNAAEARGRMGKADLPGSCEVDDCGGKSNGACWCDPKCAEYGDCCADVMDVCDLGANGCAQDADCDGFCGYEANGDRVCKPWGDVGDQCGGFVTPAYINKCDPSLVCNYPEATHDVPGTCDKPEPASCDATLICGQALTCHGGQWYGTTCGPANCDEPMGPCPTVNPPPPPPPTPVSCEGKCGGPAAGKACFCDAVCVDYGDCCNDYQAACG